MLAKILTRAQRYTVETNQNGNTNHLPMALVALNEMGANHDQLEAYYAKYAHLLVARESVTTTTHFEWEAHLGDKSAFEHYLNYFLRQVEREGIEATLRTYLDRLMLGCGASAFHAVIRLSYGVQVQNNTEVAFGLADLASSYLPVSEPLPCKQNLREVFESALSTYEGVNVQGGLISARMLSVVENPRFESVNYVSRSLDIAQISELVAELYLKSRDFTVLHAVTSCHAKRYLSHYFVQPERSLRYYWAALIAAVLSVEDLRLGSLPTTKLKPLSDMSFNAVLNSDDSHVIKLAWSCLDEFRHYQSEHHLKILTMLMEEYC